MQGFLDKLAGAIATAEGFFVAGSLPQRLNNPGDLRQAPWLQNPVLEHGFWAAPSLAAGIAGLYHQLALDVSRGWTLRQLISTYAPPGDNNNTENYIRETARRLGIPYVPPEQANQETPLWEYMELAQIP